MVLTSYNTWLHGKTTFYESRRTLTFVFLALLIPVVLLGCTPTPEVRPLKTADYPANFQFIRDGQTNRQEILERLGEPQMRYEGERIFFYVVGDNELVFVFGPNGLLKQHSVFRHAEIVDKGIRSVGGASSYW